MTMTDMENPANFARMMEERIRLKTSEKQKEANQQNAKKSTGPKTPEGKQTVAQNAVSHGFRSDQIVITGEDQVAYDQMRQGLLDQLYPQGQLELALADRVVAAVWRLRRVGRIETELLEFLSDRTRKGERDHADIAAFLKDQSQVHRLVDRHDYELGRAFTNHSERFERLTRYEAHFERSLYKALHELQRLQALRQGQPVTPPLAVDINVNTPVSL